jgi:hypothetical protein
LAHDLLLKIEKLNGKQPGERQEMTGNANPRCSAAGRRILLSILTKTTSRCQKNPENSRIARAVRVFGEKIHTGCLPNSAAPLNAIISFA